MTLSQSHNALLPKLKQPSISPLFLSALVIIFAVIGLLLVRNFAHAQRDREINYWQNRLGLIADSRSADISFWLEAHFRDLGNVANNPSLQLYLTQLLNTPVKAESALLEEPAQQVFLRNLLLMTADKLGFLPKKPDALKVIHANVQLPSGTGLAILDNSGKIIVSTGDLTSFEAGLAQKIAAAPKGQTSLLDIYTSASGELRMGFVVPVYPIQGDATASEQLGKLVGIKALDDDFLHLLQQPGITDKTLESLLLRKEGENVAYLVRDSRAEGEVQGASQFALSTANLDSAYAVLSPGTFGEKLDRQGRSVLMTSRTIAHSPWTLLVHIDRAQALADSNDWRHKMEIIMLLALVAFIASLIAVWWYGTSKRAMLLSLQTGKLAAHSVAQEKLLRLVSDNQPDPIFIADQFNLIRFANEKTARFFGAPAADIVGKNLVAVMGAGAAKEFIEANKAALETRKLITRPPHPLTDEHDSPIIRTEHIPLAHIPIDTLPYPSPGVLVVQQDVSDIVNERERRVRILGQLIKTLVRMVDERDPNAANHSASVSMVAHSLAMQLGLDAQLVETAEIAGSLMNIGKIIVPSELLTKRAQLGKDEKETIAHSLQSSVGLLREIDFDGPVADTLQQAPERYDGTGPMGLKGEAILITARIIAVANSFVGMISPRSYRAAISIEEATSLLLQGIDTQFDRKVVVALINFVENKEGRKLLLAAAQKK